MPKSPESHTTALSLHLDSLTLGLLFLLYPPHLFVILIILLHLAQAIIHLSHLLDLVTLIFSILHNSGDPAGQDKTLVSVEVEKLQPTSCIQLLNFKLWSATLVFFEFITNT